MISGSAVKGRGVDSGLVPVAKLERDSRVALVHVMGEGRLMLRCLVSKILPAKTEDEREGQRYAVNS